MRETKRIFLPSPLPHQLPILQHPARYKVMVCGRRWGKTLLGLLAVVEGHGLRQGGHRGALDGATLWWVAPAYPIASMIWRSLKRALHEVWIDKSETERRIVLPGGGNVTVKSADNPDSLRGAGLDGLVIDEAAYISEEAWTEALRPTLSDRCGWAIFISTPKGLNWFHRLFSQAESTPGWARWQRPTSDNPKIRASEIEAARRELGGYVFSQEYEAQFVTTGGGLFKREWFKYYAMGYQDQYRVSPTEIYRLDDFRRFTIVDLAASIKTTADYTVVATFGATPEGKLLVLDVLRARIEGPDIVPSLQRVHQKWHPAFIGIEKTGFQLALIQEARRSGLPIRELQADKDKVARALPATAAMEGERVLLPTSASWLSDFETELLAFPKGEHDDQVDCFGYAVSTQTRLGWNHPIPEDNDADDEEEPEWKRREREKREMFAAIMPKGNPLKDMRVRSPFEYRRDFPRSF